MVLEYIMFFGPSMLILELYGTTFLFVDIEKSNFKHKLNPIAILVGNILMIRYIFLLLDRNWFYDLGMKDLPYVLLVLNIIQIIILVILLITRKDDKVE